ncbi:MAG: DNA-directed RNA polymerase subunit beta [Elusimicrobiota bacterium]
MSERIVLGDHNFKEKELPNLVELQKASYDSFLQADVVPEARKNQGLQSVFIDIFGDYRKDDFVKENGLESLHFESDDGTYTWVLQFLNYTVYKPKYDYLESLVRDETYEIAIKANFRLLKIAVNSKDKKPELVLTQEVPICELPKMTDNATFVINGYERIIVSQLHRSPGVIFEESEEKQLSSYGKRLFAARLIPYRGAWVEFEFDIENVLFAKLDRKKKIPATMILRALGLEKNEDILKIFYTLETVNVSTINPQELIGRILAKDIFESDKKGKLFTEPLYEANFHLDKENVEKFVDTLKQHGITGVSFVKTNKKNMVIHDTLAKDKEYEKTTAFDLTRRSSQEMVESCLIEDIVDKKTGEVVFDKGTKINDKQESSHNYKKVYDKCRELGLTKIKISIPKSKQAVLKIYQIQTKSMNFASSKVTSFVEDLILKPRRYDLSPIGRYKINKKLRRIYGEFFKRKYKTYNPFDIPEHFRSFVGVFDPKEATNGLKVELEQLDWWKSPLGEKDVNDLLANKCISKDDYKKEDVKEDISKNRVLSIEDIVVTIQYLLNLNNNINLALPGKENENTMQLEDLYRSTDDIDHLGNRRVRSVGELLENQIRIGLVRIVGRLNNVQDKNIVTPRTLINAKSIGNFVQGFFGTSQLSQFMDQTNPLSELTHKRRLSALGPGGLNRKRAGFEVRDVHHTHYGRICPIETPEGANIGLITSLACHARINNYGLIETPYRKVENSKVTQEMEYLTADREDEYKIAQANTPVDNNNRLPVGNLISCRYRGDFPFVDPVEIKYMDISPLQVVSISAALIPFLEHDDVNRALMGSNMQRQSVALVNTESPLVGTGIEQKVAKDSGSVIVARNSGEVISVTANRIIVWNADKNVYDTYDLKKYLPSNQDTCLNQIPSVSVGDTVKTGQIIADGPCTNNGELALGRNLLVAFMPWEGYNFEDAVIISQRVVKEDILTSVHIKEFVTEVRETKLGPEEVTRDIPHTSAEDLANLDEEGVIRLGAAVEPGSILIGKVQPRAEQQVTPEERLLRVIFGKKAEDVIDVSLKVPAGTRGKVIEARRFKRSDIENTKDVKHRIEEFIEVFALITTYEANKLCLILEQLKDQYKTSPQELKKQTGIVTELFERDFRKIEFFINVILDSNLNERVFTLENVEGLEEKVTPLMKKYSSKTYAELFTKTPVPIAKDIIDTFRNDKTSGKNDEVNKDLDAYKANQVDSTLKELIQKIKGGKREKDTVNKLREYLVTREEIVRDDPIKLIHDLRLEFFCLQEEFESNKLSLTSEAVRHACSYMNKSGIGTMNVKEIVRIYVASRRKVQVGDKIAGRHGNKGVIARIVPEADMPYLPDGTPIDVVLSPLSVPSRMNVGQLLETMLGWAAHMLDAKFACPVFSGANEKYIHEWIAKAKTELKKKGIPEKYLPTDDCRIQLYDGRTGEPFQEKITIGYMYIMKLVHLAEDKIHARATGPYSLVTRQPLGGKAQFGGQRFGEMEVWALEGYGASHLLQEFLTVKSDDVSGRTKIYESIIKGESLSHRGVPESFKVLVNELKALGLNMQLLNSEDTKKPEKIKKI